jgi:hypothetical protein
MYAPPRKPILGPRLAWQEALDAPSAAQMGCMRRLLESWPMERRRPDQGLIAGDPGMGAEHIRALRGDGYALISSPAGRTSRLLLDRLAGKKVVA